MPALANVGVIGTGAMGLGVVQRLVLHRFAVRARDIRPQAEAAGIAAGAVAYPSPAALARGCDIVIVLVVDAPQVDDILFGAEGAAAALAPGAIVLLSSTVAPAFVESTATRLSTRGVTLLDAPVSGGPQRAAAGTMTVMLAGDADAIERCAPLFDAIAAKRFVVGARPGTAATFKVLNNQLAAVNLAAGAEAMALAIRAGVDPRTLLEVINASSGASWIFNDRMTRVLDGDATPRAAMTLLAKDSGIAVHAAATLGFDAPLARAAHEAFVAAVAAGYVEVDDSALLDYYRRREGAAALGDSP
jgi:3-hydroxyisobutyrate dehydrogenase-like beta-hydroxyacid dehydrogenase